MPLSDWSVRRDKFEFEEKYSALSFPCLVCVYRHIKPDEDPCRVCDHNVCSVDDDENA
jgi:hypothetical protein